jgi:hypothetical protein
VTEPTTGRDEVRCECGHDQLMHIGRTGRCLEPGTTNLWADDCTAFRRAPAAEADNAGEECTDCGTPLAQPDELESGLCLQCLNGPIRPAASPGGQNAGQGEELREDDARPVTTSKAASKVEDGLREAIVATLAHHSWCKGYDADATCTCRRNREQDARALVLGPLAPLLAAQAAVRRITPGTVVVVAGPDVPYVVGSLETSGADAVLHLRTVDGLPWEHDRALDPS